MAKPVRYVAVDLGDKRTGIAVADSQTRIVAPIGVLEVPIATRQGEDLLLALTKAIAEHHSPGASLELIVGLPLISEGKEGPRAKHVRAFATRLVARLNCPIHYQDETLTSVEADWSMARSGLTRGQKKAKRDALAAAVILRDFLASHASTHPASPSPNDPAG